MSNDLTSYDESTAALHANLAAGEQLSLADIPRAKVAPGGVPQFVLDDPVEDEPGTAKTIMGRVMAWTQRRALWPSRNEAGDQGELESTPICYSHDGITGNGDPLNTGAPGTGYECAKCPHSQWSSAARGKGQACKLSALLLLQDAQAEPSDSSYPLLAMTLAPTSLKPWRTIRTGLTTRNLPLYAVTLAAKVEQVKVSGSKDTYGVVKWSLVKSTDSPEERRKLHQSAGIMRQLIASRGEAAQATDNNANGADGIDGYSPF